MTRSVDLNADLGEGCPWDAELMRRITSASVGCGAHAGDPMAIARTLELARDRGVVVGAHPGYADREHFGRRSRDVTAAEVRELILDQVAVLRRLADPLGVEIRFLKPHGALYNQAQREPEVSEGVAGAVAELGLPLLAQPSSVVAARAKERGVRVIGEGFADRRYSTDGRLVPRSEAGAILSDPDEVGAQLARLIDQGVETICIHGDEPGSVALADLVRRWLDVLGVAIRPFLNGSDAAS